MRVNKKFIDLASIGLTGNDILGTASGNNNQATFANVTGLVLPADSKSGELYLDIEIAATTDVNSFRKYMFKATQDSDYIYGGGVILEDLESEVEIQILSNGQVQYKSGNYAGFTSLTFRWRIISTT